MDTIQRDKEKEKERDVPPGEQTPKVSGVDCKGRPGPADEPYGLVGTLNLGLGRFRDKVFGLGRTDLWSDLASRVGLLRTDYGNLLVGNYHELSWIRLGPR
ncbi:hypothetical protein F2Q69_00041545 [Brassica cretica]|uniref:Uncharacterized protein n=1 Tax=Brassica cretica TaxID=69181 RepID=A0A8S9NFC9_BRACR|nr:hypothetical protein F2Q69_00041545 [Brassica cretica]